MERELNRYREIRNFDQTPEPAGDTDTQRRKKSDRLIFAVQYHVASRPHYDLRLEWEGVLLSWAVPKGPSFDPRDKRLAVHVEDHPLDYADFEGTIPAGQYGGGTVMLWDEGTWEPFFDPGKGLREGSLKFTLNGSRLKGKWALVRFADEKTDKNWLLVKDKDAYALDTDGIADYTTGIRSGRTIEQIDADENETNRRNPFDDASPMLATLTDKLPEEDDEWLFEVKYDGYRMLAYTENGAAKLVSRNKSDFSDRFRVLTDSLAEWSRGRALVLDGEVVVTDDAGRSDFQALQNYAKNPHGKSPVYMAFDLLAADGEDLRALPLTKRKERLEALLEGAPPDLIYCRHVEGNGHASLEAAQELGLEGIVGKRADSPYRSTRSGDWIKLKCYLREEFVIGGYTVSPKNVSGISALLLGAYRDGKLVYAGRAGTGFNARNIRQLKEAFRDLALEDAPFAAAPELKRGEKVFWLKPERVAVVQFAERTDVKRLRQASFKGLREDKDSREITVEGTAEKPAPTPHAKPAAAPAKKRSSAKKQDEPTVLGVKISSPDKVLYTSPDIRKIDVVRYYEQVSERLMRYAGGRVLSVVRCHEGAEAACFFKKHPNTENEGVTIIPIANTEGAQSDYFYLETAAGLIAEVQLGTVEFHVWGSRAEALERPDMMVFDLDPDEGMATDRIREGVRDLKSLLDGLGLTAFLKTSGGKGYHVVVPFRPAADWDTFREFARGIAQLMEQKWPDRYTANMRKSGRKGKIYIDWVRNGRGATGVAAYSLRARPGAKVSMPIEWSELDDVAPNGIDMAEALKRLERPDPWAEYDKVEQSLQS